MLRSPAYQNKIKSAQSILAPWDLGIMLEHENFGFEVTNNDGDGLIYVVIVIKRSLDKNMTTKLA